MSIRKYTNFDSINTNLTNEGQFLQEKDLFIVSKNETEEAEFGECKYDVMEVSVYDVNNTLLPQKTGNNVAYIKKNDIGSYMYSLVNTLGKKELAINIEKLLNDLGFTNGILKVNINFVRSRVGSDNELERVWIHEISPSREEIRIIPLKTSNPLLNNINTTQFKNLNNLNKDFKFYKKNILDGLDSFESTSLDSINDALTASFGNDFQNILKKDFGLSNFNEFKKKIFTDFRDSVTHWLNNKNYNIRESTFGSPSEIRFDDCDQYDFNYLISEIKNILNDCITFNLKSLNRRFITFEVLPVEFAVTEVQKQIQNLLDSYGTRTEIKRNVYAPDKVAPAFKGVMNVPPPIPEPAPTKPPVVQPAPVVQPTPPKPVLKTYIYFVSNGSGTTSQYGSGFTNSFGYYDVDGVERIGKSLRPGESTTVCAQQGTVRGGGPNWTINQGVECGATVSTPVTTPSYSGGGTRSGGGVADNTRGLGRDVVVERDLSQRENIQ
jgi:hypothetical protein